MMPRMNEKETRKTEAQVMTAKKVQVMNVQRNVVEKNMTPQPPR